MNYIKYLSIAAAVVFAGTAISCNKQNNSADSAKNHADSAKNQAQAQGLTTQAVALANAQNKTLADSAAYYMGMTSAIEFLNIAKQDTTLAGDENAKLYQQGLLDGLKMAEQKGYAYNVGFAQGINLAANIKDIDRELGVKLETNRLAQGFNYGMQQKDSIDINEYTQSMQQIGMGMQAKAMEKIAADPAKQQQLQQMQQQQEQIMQQIPQPLADKAGANQKTKSGIRYKVVKAGIGATPTIGDNITISMTMKDAKGKVLQSTKNGDTEYMTFPMTMQDVPDPAFIEIFQTIKEGGHSTFYVPVPDANGNYSEMVLDVKLSKVEKKQ